MKFLGIRNGHDCNLTYTDGTKVKYIKLERNEQQKHFLWTEDPNDHTDDIEPILKKAKDQFNIPLDQLDGICINLSGDRHMVFDYIQPNEVVRPVDKKKNLFWDQFKCPVYVIDHHYAHVLSCWPLADMSKIETNFVLDAEGDFRRNASIFKKDKLVEFIHQDEGWGLSTNLDGIGKACGMKGMVLDFSGKVMALKSFHKVSQEEIQKVITATQPLSYRHMQLFAEIIKTIVKKKIDPKEFQSLIDAAYLLHEFCQIKIPQWFDLYTDDRNDTMTYSGGTAQNTCVNTYVRQMFPNIIIPPHCPDDGISLGCVEYLRQLYDQPFFDNSQFPYWQTDEAPAKRPTAATIKKTAELIAQGKIVGWYQGHGEIGPRALGNRSILMDPSIKNGKDLINYKVKKREPYRPFGASIMLGHQKDYFTKDWDSPFMLYVIDFKTKDFPAVAHVDNTCRVQTVSNTDPATEDYHWLISAFNNLTGIPMVLNTSLNVDGKPIAGHIADANLLFEKSQMDALVVGDDIRIK